MYDVANFKPMNYKVEFLTDTNYGIWNIKLTQALREHFVYNVAIGKDPKPGYADAMNPTKNEKEAKAVWTRKDNRAMGLLLEWIKGMHVHLIEGAETAAEMWKRIEHHFARDAAMGPAYAIQSLFTHKWDDSASTLDDNLAYIQDKVNELRKFKGLASALMTLLHSLALIQSLPSSWSQTVNVLMAKDTTDLDNVVTTLKWTAQLLEVEEGGESALTLCIKGRAANSKGSGSQAKKNDFLCDNCGKPGHTKEYCWAKGGGRKGKGPKANQYGSGPTKPSKGRGKGKEKRANVATTSEPDKEADSDVEATAALIEIDFNQQVSITTHRNSTQSPLPIANLNLPKSVSAVMIAAVTRARGEWILDSGASAHICGDKSLLHNYKPVTPIPVRGFGENMQISAIGKGCILLTLKPQSEKFTLNIANVLYIPGASCNILSASKLMKSGIDLKGKADAFELYQQEKLIAKAPRIGGMEVDTTANYENPSKCASCLKGKMMKSPFPTSDSHAKSALDLIHTDLAGPLPTAHKGYRYMQVLLDNATGFLWLYFLKKKSATYAVFEHFKPAIKLELNKKIKVVHSDNGGEFVNDKLANFFAKAGIKHETTTLHTPSSNGDAE
ncbi:hypothetical protein M0805_000583 [Coniferiporia weirii]|nr:hypothetical protein M0805_000583 [Coniferiporia weirii]